MIPMDTTGRHYYTTPRTIVIGKMANVLFETQQVGMIIPDSDHHRISQGMILDAFNAMLGINVIEGSEVTTVGTKCLEWDAECRPKITSMLTRCTKFSNGASVIVSNHHRGLRSRSLGLIVTNGLSDEQRRNVDAEFCCYNADHTTIMHMCGWAG